MDVVNSQADFDNLVKKYKLDRDGVCHFPVGLVINFAPFEVTAPINIKGSLGIDDERYEVDLAIR